MKKVVIFGAGATGRGHIGQLAYASGYQLVFVDRDEALVRKLAESGRYTVRLVGPQVREMVVAGFKAYPLRQEEAIAEEIVTCDLVLTAVMAENLAGVAPCLARGLARRMALRPGAVLNVIACENMIGGSAALREHVLRALPEGERERVSARVGFPNAMIARVVPAPKADPLFLEAEDYNEWPVDRGAFLGEDPGIDGLLLVDNLPARLERKLFMHNTGHAVCGYLGWLKGYEVMCDAVRDPWIQGIVRGAMVESGEALIHKHGFSREEIEAYREGFFPRVASPLIQDPVARVIRSPRRKIGRHERLTGPACLALDYGIEPRNLALGLAALLKYRAPDDPEAEEIQRLLKAHGLAYVLQEVAGVDLGTYKALLDLVQEAMETIEHR